MALRSRVTLMLLLAGLSFLPRLFSETEVPPDKRGYNLFNPTPDKLLRELATDRPDKTENPYTVDAGHYQIELDLLNYTFDRQESPGANLTVRSLAIAPFNFKFGLFNNLDVQFIAETFVVQKTHDHDTQIKQTRSGFGDMAIRGKMNIWGNDGGKTALGVIAFAKFPTNQDGLGNKAVEGGLIIPLEVKLPQDWDLGLMTEVDDRRNSNDSDYHAEFINTITVSHEIVGKLEGYVEFYSSVSQEKGADWIGTVDVGVTYKLSPNIQLDAGVNIGVTEAADDLNPFLGLSVRY